MPVNKTYFNWSSGKDCAMHQLLKDKNYSVEYLLTTVNGHYNRVSMHGLRTELLQQQVESIGIQSGTVAFPEHITNEDYEKQMGEKVNQLKEEGFTHAGFGDIFLEDLREYREQQLNSVNIKTVFPLWKRDTRQLINEFIDLGFKAIVICINANVLDQSFAGRIIDKGFINDLPESVDPCGENGEFHSFVYDGPIFNKKVPHDIGELVLRENRFFYCDLIPYD